MLDDLMKFYVKNKLFDRALEIIQDETYLDEADFDVIKRQKRQSSVKKYQPEDKINSGTIEAFFGALHLHEIVKMHKMQIRREKRQTINIITPTNFNLTLDGLNSLDDTIDALRGVPEFEELRQQYCDLATAEFFRGTLLSELQSNFSAACSDLQSSMELPPEYTFPINVPSFLSFQGQVT